MIANIARETLGNNALLWLTEQSKVQKAPRRNVENISRVADTEIGLFCRPRRARPEACPDFVAALGKGYGHYLRTAPCRAGFRITQS